MLLVTSCWVSCDGLASHLGGGGVVMLLVTSCYGNRVKSSASLEEPHGFIELSPVTLTGKCQ